MQRSICGIKSSSSHEGQKISLGSLWSLEWRMLEKTPHTNAHFVFYFLLTWAYMIYYQEVPFDGKTMVLKPYMRR
jgi:hypothetical protein